MAVATKKRAPDPTMSRVMSDMLPDLVPVAGVQRRTMSNSLFQAILNCRLSKVKFLLDNGTSPSIKNDQGQNLLVAALYIPRPDKRNKMFQYLLQRGVDCCEIDSKMGRDVLSWACCLGRVDQVHSIMKAAMGEIDLVRKDNEGNTPLHHATKAGHVEVVEILVNIMGKYRLSVDVADDEGLTPYIYARRYGHLDIAHILLTEGHASYHQFDSVTYRSADSWADIGVAERKVLAKRNRERELAQYKICGRLPPIENSHQLPDPKLHVVFAEDNNSKDSGVGTDRNSITSKESKSDSLASDRNNGQPKPPRYSRKTGKTRNMTYPSLLNKSLDTAFTLWTLTHDTSDNPPTHFVDSQFDTTKASEYSSIMSDVTHMMAVLSDQQTDAFRKVAKPPTPTLPPPKLVSPRPKVSTLAILFGRDKQHTRKTQKSQKTRRKTAARPMGTNKPGKTLRDYARERRQRNK